MKKYDMHICKCGRIHMVDMEKLDKALEANKNLLLICGGCGGATVIGADIEPDYIEPDKDCYNLYQFDFSQYEDAHITEAYFAGDDKHKAIMEIIYSHGIKVPMMTGMYATDYFDGNFSDRWYPDFYKIQRRDVTVEEIMEFIDQYNKDRTTVNMNRFINENPEDIIEEISHYYIRGFDWSGTKWATTYNV